MPSTAKPSADAMLRQGLRYLAASVQDGHPLFGLIHANYAKILFEELIRSGAEADVRSYLKAANLAAYEWQCPDDFAREAWSKLTAEQKKALDAAVDVVIEAAEAEMASEQ